VRARRRGQSIAARQDPASHEAARRLEAGLAALGIPASQGVAGRLLDYADLLLAGNAQTNLVGAKTLGGLVGAHLLDSLAPLAGRALAEPVVDLGSGGGLPGIPAAIAWPELDIVLLEPRAKRARFLRGVLSALALANVRVEQATSQRAARHGMGGQAGTVLARALAAPARAIALALPLLRAGGRLILYQGRAAAPDKAGRKSIAALGGRLVEARRVTVPYLVGQRHVWVVENGVRKSSPARRLS